MIRGYQRTGTIFLWLGSVVTMCSLCLFLTTWFGIPIEGSDQLNLHDTYYVQFSSGARLMLLLSLVVGGLLIVSGRFARSQAIERDSKA